MSETRPATDKITATPVESTLASYHEPRVYAETVCLAACKKLRPAVNGAILRAARNPEAQIDVVCSENRRFGCNATTIEAGDYNDDWGNRVPGSDELFLVNPVIVSTASKEYNPPELIERAIESGIEPVKATDV